MRDMWPWLTLAGTAALALFAKKAQADQNADLVAAGEAPVVGPVQAVVNSGAAAFATVKQLGTDWLTQITPDINVTLTRAQVEAMAQGAVKLYPNVDWRVLVTLAKIESSWKTAAYRVEHNSDGSVRDVSYGLVQLLASTALWEYTNLGVTDQGPPNQYTLLDPNINLYFAAGYVNYLMRYAGRARTLEWYIRAYNGGPGWASSSKGQTMTAAYWAAFQQAWKDLGYV